jgi:hypothetical protein
LKNGGDSTHHHHLFQRLTILRKPLLFLIPKLNWCNFGAIINKPIHLVFKEQVLFALSRTHQTNIFNTWVEITLKKFSRTSLPNKYSGGLNNLTMEFEGIDFENFVITK